jgi:hypothetical protein
MASRTSGWGAAMTAITRRWTRAARGQRAGRRSPRLPRRPSRTPTLLRAERRCSACYAERMGWPAPVSSNRDRFGLSVTRA